MAHDTLICPRCSAASAATARYCGTCGAPLTAQPREERRIVTVLFGDVAGFTELSERRDAEEVKAIVDRTFDQVSEIIERFGGRVDNVIGDEIMAVFGAPVAHEDDAERAVRAALEIRRTLDAESEILERERGFPLRMHIGLNTGEVVAGFVGGSDTYTVLGDAVNTARRIEEAADPGQVLVGEWTYEASRQAIEYLEVGQVTAKGKRLPVTVWEAVSERGLPGHRAGRPSPLIGREEELALLEALAGMVRRDRRPIVATLVGEAGMGKSRVCAEFARVAEAAGTRVLRGRSLPYGTASPAFALEEMVREALRLDAGMPAEQAREVLRARLEDLGLGAETERAMALLGLGGSVPVRDTVAGPGAAPAGVAHPLLESARKILTAVADREGTLVLSFHEMHWAEDAVLDWVAELQRSQAAPILTLCLARPRLLDRKPRWLGGVGSVVVQLDPLPRDRAGEMLDGLASGLGAALRESVLDRAGGNPFYLEELAHLLVDRPEAGPDVAVPISVQALVAARLDSLAPDEKRLLQDAAVVGEQFWLGALRRLRSAEDGEDAVESLVAKEFIEPFEGVVLPGDHGYRFRQTLVREVSYNSVPKHVRARQHADVGAWLEEVVRTAGKEREFSDLIAYHYESAALAAREVGSEQSGAEIKAHEYLLRSGEEALGKDASGAARGFFQRALAFAKSDADRLSLRIRLAESLVAIWQHEAAEESIKEALAAARRLGDRATEGRALRLLGDSLRMRGDFEGAREPIQKAWEIARLVGDQREEAEGLRSQGLLAMAEGQWSSSEKWFGDALERYRALGDRRGEGWALQNLGWASMLMGKGDEALAYLQDGERVFADMGDEEGVGWCVGIGGWVLLLRGEVGRAGEIAERLEHQLRVHSTEYARNVGFALDLQRILLAYVSVLRAHFAEAEAGARAAIGAGQSAAWVLALGRYPLFISAMLGRRLGDARAAAEEGARAARSFGDPFYEGQWWFARTWLAFEEGRIDEVESALDALAERGELGRLWSGSSGVVWLRARVLQARGKLDEARELLRAGGGRENIGLISPSWCRALLAEIEAERGDIHAAAAAEAVELAGERTIARIRAECALAATQLEVGDANLAEQTLRGALAALEETDWSYRKVRALALLARILDAQRRHDEAAEAFDRARDIIAALPPGTDTGPAKAVLLG